MNLWDRILTSLQPKVNRHSFNTWLKPTQQLAFADGTLHVEVPSVVFADWISRNYLPMIQESAREIEVGDLRLEFKSRQTGSVARQAAASLTAVAEEAPVLAPLGTGLNPRYSFDSFVVSSCNEFAHAAAVAVAQQPSSAYNPLYVYGGVGLGKTHLMHAIGNQVLRSRMAIRHLYITTETFMNDLINSIRFEKTIDFKERYRNVDLLLIDDIQFLAGKERTQEEFFHTFNALYESQKQIVITSDCPPRDIPTLEERLRSRFEWGLIADIQPPDLETKVAILKKKAEAENVRLPEDVAHFIAGRVRSNIRELEGSLIRVVAYASLMNRPVDLAMAEDTLKDLMDDRSRAVTPEMIQKLVAGHFHIRPMELKSRNNSRHIAFPRQVAMFLCKRLTDKSLPAIGGAFGGKHHTTVIHAIRKIEGMRDRDKEFARLLDGFMESFG
jgi:chromosomal replication initiator protein